MKTLINHPKTKSTLNEVEILGLEKAFNLFYSELTEGCSKEIEFFYCSDTLCSTDAANGTHLTFDGLKLQYLTLGLNGKKYFVCEDANENEFYFTFEIDGRFTQIAETAEVNTVSYYREQLNKISINPKSEYASSVKVFGNGNGEDTKHLSLNQESAQDLINWLKDNFNIVG